MNTEYYLLEDGERTGPYTIQQLIKLDLDVNTQIATSAIGEWQYASDIPELDFYFESRGIHFPTGDNLASFGWRALAIIIDYIIIAIPIEIILIKQGLLKLPTGPGIEMPSQGEMQLFQICFAITFVLYNTILESTPLKGSLGKKICGLVVVDIDGKNPSILRVFVRNMGALLSTVILFGVSFFSMFFSEYKQTWYDSLTKAYVLRIRR